jgi:predicted RNase H-like HicB family nuclease
LSGINRGTTPWEGDDYLDRLGQGTSLSSKAANCYAGQIREGTGVVTLPYPAEVFWSEEDGGWIAAAPDLPGCSAFGESRPEALKELELAIEAWIEAAKAAGNAIPQPSHRLRA